MKTYLILENKLKKISHFSKNFFLLSRIFNPRLIFVLFYFIFSSDINFAQSICGTISQPNADPYCTVQGSGDCATLLDGVDALCVRIKFHIIDNDGNPNLQTDKTPDYKLYELIEKINAFYSNSKIRFSIGNNCTHRAELNISSFVQFKSHYQGSPDYLNKTSFYNLQFIPNSELQWDTNSINIFIFTVGFGPAKGEGKFYPYIISDQDLLSDLSTTSHELGHTLSLKHTFGAGDPSGGQTLPIYWECKDGSNWTNTGDFIKDTGADPATQDLEMPFGSPDGLRSCYDNSTHNVPDACGNSTQLWNIPFNNIMSYYYNRCPNSQFSPCQKLCMNNYLVTDNPKLILNCSDDFYTEIPCNDIVINNETTWVNQTIYLCQGQKIIITSSGKLTIQNCTLTKSNPSPQNPNCPSFVKNGPWDGFYIEGGVGSIKLVIQQGSIIEHSTNGINSTNPTGTIVLGNCTFRHNGRIAKLAHKAKIFIWNSELLVDHESFNINESIHQDQIFLNGADISMDYNTKFEVGSQSLLAIGINSSNGKVKVSNSTLKNFKLGIMKDLGGTINVNGARFLTNKDLDILNTSNSLILTNSYLERGLTSQGSSTGLISNNHFKGITINNTISCNLVAVNNSNVITENYFTNSVLFLNGNNPLTDATCNRWKTDIAVDAAATLPQSWGTKILGSGNKWEGAIKPDMYSPMAPIINYELPTDQNHVFNYYNPFQGVQSSNDFVNCNYYTPPSSVPGGGGTPCNPCDLVLINEDVILVNWTYLNNQWLELQSQIQGIQSGLSGLSGSSLLTAQDNLENLQILVGQLVNEALQAITVNTDVNLVNLWKGRASPSTFVFENLLAAINNQNWTQALAFGTILQSDDDYVMSDKFNFQSAISYLQNLEYNGSNINQLNDVQLLGLVDFCDDTFGDYTAALRNFMNVHYGIIILNTNMNSYTKKGAHFNKSNQEIEDTLSNKISIIPNPNSGNFEIIKSNKVEFSDIMIKNLNGSVCYHFTDKNTSKFSLPNIEEGIYLLQYIIVGETKLQFKKLIIIK